MARTDRAFGPGRFRATFLLSRDVFANVVARSGLIHDTRFVPGRSGRSSDVLLYLITAGTLELLGTSGRTLHGPVAFLMAEDQFEGSDGRPPLPLRTFGDPFVAIELRFSRSDCALAGDRTLPVELVVPAPVWDAARALVESAEKRDGLEAGLRDVLSALGDAGVVSRGLASGVAAEDPRLARIWAAARPLTEAFDLVASLDGLALAAGLSLRQITREVEGFAGSVRIPFGGWRESMRRYRIKAAILGLSVAELPIAEVAHIAGYGSVEAMARAFRDAALPAPTRVRAEMLGEPPRG